MSTVLFVALVWKVIDFLRLVPNYKTQRSSIVTQVLAWGAAILVVAIGAHATVSAGVVLPGVTVTLGSLDTWSIILLGLMVGSTASASVDIKQALDGTDSAAKPPLLPAPALQTPETVIAPALKARRRA